MQTNEPFTGTWIFNPSLSKLSSPAPAKWVQWIVVTSEDVSVREEITRGGGAAATVSVQAKFDGKEYPVHGSPGADVIAYTRVHSHRIAAIARKNGVVSLRESLTAAADGETITLEYSVIAAEREIANGTAVFERRRD